MNPGRLDRTSFLESFSALLDQVVVQGPPPETGPAAPLFDPQSDPSMLAWAQQELGLKLDEVPKLRAAFLEALHAFQRGRDLQLALLGPRTGGKTMLNAALEVLAWRWFGGDCTNVAGSGKQAQECYGYIRKWIGKSDDLRRFHYVTTQSLTTSKAGGKIIVCTASQTSVRGPHPKGPSGLGLVCCDEEAVMEAAIQEAAVDQLGAARPKAQLRSSTLGKVGGTLGQSWRKLVDNPKAQGFSLHSWSAFDVAARCPYDCKKEGGAEVGGCPLKEHFADDYYEGPADRQVAVHQAYCGGVAHQVDGWHSVDFLAMRFKQMDRESFEREYIGRGAAARAGKVYDPALIDAAVLPGDLTLSRDGNPEQHRHRLRALRKKTGLDWGFAGQSALAYGLELPGSGVVVIYRWGLYTETRFSSVRADLVEHAFAERVGEVWPDSASPSDNAELAEDAGRRSRAAGARGDADEEAHEIAVRPVVFSRDKAFGIGEVRRRLEKGLLKFASSFGGEPVQHFERAIEYLKSYSRDENGNPIKKDDHVPDALLCVCVGFGEGVRAPVPGRV